MVHCQSQIVNFFQYLQMTDSEESAGHYFAAYLLEFLDYDCDDRYLCTNKAGQLAKGKADIALMDDDFHLLGNFLKLQCCLFSLIVDKSQRGLSGDRAEPRLIFKAIAVFYMNNLCRSRSALPLWERQVIPGIVMVGTAPTFYRITVTTAYRCCGVGEPGCPEWVHREE